MASKKLGKLIDELYERRDARIAMQRTVDKMKEKEGALEQRVIAELQRANLQKAGGEHASVSLTPKTVAQVEPERWADVHKYIAKTGAWDLLQKRINNQAVRDRVENGEEIPGVKTIQILDLSVRGL